MLRGLANAEMGMMRKKSKRSDVVRVCGKSNMEKKKDKGRKNIAASETCEDPREQMPWTP